MSRGLLSAGLGAGAATVYLKPEIVQDWAKELAFGPRTFHPSLEPVGKELEHLQRLVSMGAPSPPPLAPFATGLLL